MRNAQRGFSYLIVLFAVALLGAGLAATGTVWHTANTREKETELLFIGNAYRDAIRSFYERTPSGVKAFPGSLKDLEKDPRVPAAMRHIRRLYRDPVTGTADWGLIAAPGGGIMGVYSKSEAQPLKLANFDLPNRIFEERAMLLQEKMTYRDWQFAYPAGAGVDPRVPQAAPQLPQSGAGTPNP